MIYEADLRYTLILMRYFADALVASVNQACVAHLSYCPDHSLSWQMTHRLNIPAVATRLIAQLSQLAVTIAVQLPQLARQLANCPPRHGHYKIEPLGQNQIIAPLATRARIQSLKPEYRNS